LFSKILIRQMLPNPMPKKVYEKGWNPKDEAVVRLSF
jgi:hypothetical protein